MDPRLAAMRRWGLPALGALVVLALLSPGLISHESDATPSPGEPLARAGSGTMLPSAERSLPGARWRVGDPDAAADGLAGSPGPAVGLLQETGGDLPASFDCVIEPSETVDLGSPVTGVLHRMHIERGAIVKAGDPIAELESSVERAAVELARARSRMEGALKAREASHALGVRRRDRVSQLFANDTLSADLLDQAETEARIAELDLLEAQEHKRLASLELAQARALLRRRTIRSPIDGIVVSRAMTAGEVVVDEKTIATIARIDPLRVEVILPSAFYGTIAEGQRAAVEPEFGDTVHIAQVEIVDRVIDAASGTFGVRLELPNPEQAIPGGLHCQVRFLAE
jgi:RND family efflux transporter MFP subunit